MEHIRRKRFVSPEEIPFKLDTLGLLPKSVYTYQVAINKFFDQFYKYDKSACEKFLRKEIDEDVENKVLSFLSKIIFDGENSRFYILTSVFKRLELFSSKFWHRIRMLRVRKKDSENKIYLSKEEMGKIFDGIERMDIYLTALMQFFLGLRAGEALNLQFNVYKRLPIELRKKYIGFAGEEYIDKPDSLDFKNGKYYLSFIGKGHNRYTIQVPLKLGEEVMKIINSIVENEIVPILKSELFPRIVEKKNNPQYNEYVRLLKGYYLWSSFVHYWRVLKRVASKTLNKEVKTHDLRRSFGRITYNANKDIILVKELLRHRSVLTTQTYIGKPKEKDKVKVLDNLYNGGGESETTTK